jgi:hypothetical protein
MIIKNYLSSMKKDDMKMKDSTKKVENKSEMKDMKKDDMKMKDSMKKVETKSEMKGIYKSYSPEAVKNAK